MTDEKFAPPTEMSPQLRKILSQNPKIAQEFHQQRANAQAEKTAEPVSYQVFLDGKGGVVCQFNQQILWVNFEPQSALKFGQMMIQGARKAMKQKKLKAVPTKVDAVKEEIEAAQQRAVARTSVMDEDYEPIQPEEPDAEPGD